MWCFFSITPLGWRDFYTLKLRKSVASIISSLRCKACELQRLDDSLDILRRVTGSNVRKHLLRRRAGQWPAGERLCAVSARMGSWWKLSRWPPCRLWHWLPERTVMAVNISLLNPEVILVSHFPFSESGRWTYNQCGTLVLSCHWCHGEWWLIDHIAFILKSKTYWFYGTLLSWQLFVSSPYSPLFC